MESERNKNKRVGEKMVKIVGPDKIIIAKKKKDNLQIFLDLDGVCSYWEKSTGRACDINIENKEIREQLKNGITMEDLVGGDNKMWRLIDKAGEEFWENMEILTWAQRLYKELNERTKDFCFLTSPSKNPVCTSGKIRWLQKHFGKDFKDFLIGRNKHLCAGPNALLIDDNEKKCKKFEEFGGNIFLWPNLLKLIDGDIDIDETFEELFELIEKLKG